MALTGKQKRFCDEYLIDLNATQAAIRAGYSEKTAEVIGFENLRKPKLKKYIETRMAEKEEKLIADQDEVLRYLTAVLRGEEKEEVVVVENVGDFQSKARIVEKGCSIKDRTKAAELIGKRYGLYTDNVTMEIAVPVFEGECDLED